MPLIKFSDKDISRETARRAFHGTSWSPEKRGDGVINSYVAHMQDVSEEFGKWVTDDNRAEMSQDLEAYRAKYVALLLKYLHSHASVMSAFVTGPSNFPTRRNNKRADWADNHRDRWLEFSKKRLQKLRRKYNPRLIARAPVKSDDPEAVTKLRAKLEKHQKFHEQMKAANRVIRKKGLTDDEQRVAKLVEIGLTEASAWKLLEPDYMGREGFPSFQLTNNLATIKRLEERIKKLERLAEVEATETEYPGGVTVEEDPDDYRIRLRFPGKPDRETRTRLKKLGFRWSPRNTAWQRHLNDNGRYAVEQFLEDYNGQA